MAPFQWRLQSVLDIKEKQEQLKRAELAEIDKQIIETQNEIKRQRKIIADLLNELERQDPKTRMQKQGFMMAQTKTNDDFILKLEQDINQLRTKRKQAMDEVLELKKVTEGLSKLRTKSEQEFISELDKQEQKGADEMTSYRFAVDRLEQKLPEKVGL
ncbi:MAG: flagellar export protein FliJ [Planctomycetota bacterium]|jgi:flagellar export protein FliJ